MHLRHVAGFLLFLLFGHPIDFAAAQTVVRVVSNSKLELTLKQRGHQLQIDGILQDDLGIPIIGQEIDVVLLEKGLPSAQLLKNTESDGRFSIHLKRISKGVRVQTNFRGSDFYRGTSRIAEPDQIDSDSNTLTSLPKKSLPLTASDSPLKSKNSQNLVPLADYPNPFWLLFPMVVCSMLVLMIRKRGRRTLSQIQSIHYTPIAGIEASQPRRHARTIHRSISGTIRDLHTSELILRSEVELTYQNGSIKRTFDTEVGSFEIADLESGQWLLHAKANGYIEEKKGVFLPHRGEWKDMKIWLESMRSRVFGVYRSLAVKLLPSPTLVDIWTPREVINNIRNMKGNPKAYQLLLEFIERMVYGATSPTQKDIQTIDNLSRSELDTLSHNEFVSESDDSK